MSDLTRQGSLGCASADRNPDESRPGPAKASAAHESLMEAPSLKDRKTELRQGRRANSTGRLRGT